MRKKLLHLIEQLGLDNGQMLALVHELLVHDLPEVNPVAQQMKQRTAAERRSAQRTATAGDVPL